MFNEESGQTSLLSHRGALVLSCLSPDADCDVADLQVTCGLDSISDAAEFISILAALRTSGLIIG